MYKTVIIVLLFGILCQAAHINQTLNNGFEILSTVKRQFMEPEHKNTGNVQKNQEGLDEGNIGKTSSEVPQFVTKKAKEIDSSKPDLIKEVKQDFVKDKVNVTHVDKEETKTNVTDKHVDEPFTVPAHPRGKSDREHTGALLRGFYVFLGLSVLVVIYFSFRAFRVRPGAPPPSTVRKYGVVGRRSDMEMLPLPLTEDEDDDTVFDANQRR